MGRKLKDLRVQDLKRELNKRSLPTAGQKSSLIALLQEAMEKEGKDPETYIFEDELEPEESAVCMTDLLNALMMMKSELKSSTANLMSSIEEQKSSTAELKSSMEVSVTELKSSMEEQKSSTAELKSSIEEQKSSTAELKSSMEVSVTELKSSMEEQKSSMEVSITELKSSMEVSAAEIKSSVEASITELKSSLEEQRLSVAEIKEEQKSLALELRTSIEEVKSDVEISVQAVKNDLENVKADLEKVKNRPSMTMSADVSGNKRLHPPTFDGQTPWQTYRLQFETAAAMNFWSDEEKATALILALRGAAAELLQTIPAEQRYSYTSLIQALELRYGNQHMQEVYRLQLRSRVQKPGETLQQLCADIERLTHLAYPSFGQDYVNEVAREAFINSLADRDLQQAARLAGKNTNAEVLAYALAYEAARQASRTTVRLREVTETEDTCCRINTSENRGRLRCWTCNQEGHFQRNCRKRRRGNSPTDNNRINRCEKCKERERAELQDTRAPNSMSTLKQEQGNE